MIVLLDAGPLGKVSNPRVAPLNTACYLWLENLVRQGATVDIPEITDYEIRRELLRANKVRGLARLDWLKQTLDYLPLNTSIMLKAAELWAQVRQRGTPTAAPQELDGDVILAAQAWSVGGLVATENVGHLARLVAAEHWQNITL